MTVMLSDIEQDALSVAVQSALSLFGRVHAETGPDGYRAVIRQRQEHGRRLGAEFFETQARRMNVTAAQEIAALSMLPGGIRIGGVVFCAEHHPAGTVSPWRYTCGQCDPDSSAVVTPAGRMDKRDTVAVDGGRYV